jgi:hypothetical protein
MRTSMIERLMGVVVTLLLLAVSFNASASNMSDIFNKMFDSMTTNAAPPSSFSAMTRSGYSGGQFEARSPIMKAQLITVTPPNFKAGCGGISFYGGAFSHISAAQFKALLNAVAQNATGYAFQLAMNTMCPSCNQVMASLADKITKLGTALSDSCKLGQALVDKGVPSLKAASDESMAKYAATTSAEGSHSDPLSALMSGPLDNIIGGGFTDKDTKANVLWRAMKVGNLTSWFGGNSMDYTELVLAMNMVGTIIREPKPSDAAKEGDGGVHSTQTVSPNGLGHSTSDIRLHLADFVIPDPNKELYTCSDGASSQDCLTLVTSPITNFSSAYTTLEQANVHLFGSNTQTVVSNLGILGRIGGTVVMSDTEKKFLASLSPSDRLMITANRTQQQTLQSIGSYVAKKAAWTQGLNSYLQILNSVEAVLSNHRKHPEANILLESIKEQRTRANSDYRNEMSRIVNEGEVLTYLSMARARIRR